MNIKEKLEKEKQATKILYIAVGAMLVVMAVIVLLSSALARRERPAPALTTDEGVVTKAPDTQTHSQDAQTQRPADSSAVTLPTAAGGDEDYPAPPPASQVPTLASPVREGVIMVAHSGKDLVYSSTMEDYRAHTGIDVSASLGDKVYACAVGTITDVWYDAMMGRCVKVEHNGGLETIYKNLREELCDGIGIGSSLLAGDAIGYVGESAMIELAEEPHVHFEARIDGKYVDPVSLMSDEAKSVLMKDTGYEG